MFSNASTLSPTAKQPKITPPDAQSISTLRAHRWSDLPSGAGVYWWYFSETELDRLRISEFCQVDRLKLRRSPDGKLCLYHGMAKQLAQRVRWHAERPLSLDDLRSGILSTFRFTLLSLNDFDYLAGSDEIDRFMDDLSLSWIQANSREEAEAIESAELAGEFQFPLNISQNKCVDLKSYLRFLSSIRKAYKQRYLATENQPDRSSRVTQSSAKKKSSARVRLDESF